MFLALFYNSLSQIKRFIILGTLFISNEKMTQYLHIYIILYSNTSSLGRGFTVLNIFIVVKSDTKEVNLSCNVVIRKILLPGKC